MLALRHNQIYGNMYDPPSMAISFSSTILVSAAVISLR